MLAGIWVVAFCAPGRLVKPIWKIVPCSHRTSNCSARRNNWFLATILSDLDRFKLVNDTYGYVGDKVLQAVAQRLHRRVRNEDSLCRYRGDAMLPERIWPCSSAAVGRYFRFTPATSGGSRFARCPGRCFLRRGLSRWLGSRLCCRRRIGHRRIGCIGLG
jgi:hypothetical protein